ncbi:hypothetical protein BKA57DRAFT_457671 [Linnemannia elongata]|nr:hypothetical protein BKA57DRAFT_457671 [Linnemannia elongata]
MLNGLLAIICGSSSCRVCAVYLKGKKKRDSRNTILKEDRDELSDHFSLKKKSIAWILTSILFLFECVQQIKS